MEVKNIVLIILICVIVILIALNVIHITSKVDEFNESLLYYRLDNSLCTKKKSADILHVMKDVVDESNIKLQRANKFMNAQFVSFVSLDFIDKLIHNVNFPIECTHVYGIGGTDTFASKSSLYDNLRKTLPSRVLKTIVPKTYVIENKKDMVELYKKTESCKMVYIAKKNVQRQNGFDIYTDPKNTLNPEFVVVQEMLQNPYIISGRKINIRVYLLIVIDGSDIDFYVYKDGFIYYTAEEFEKYSTDFNKTITTGYIDRRVYDENPLTLLDLEKYMGEKNYSTLMKNVLFIIKCFKEVYKPILLEENRGIRPKQFLIYGCDIAPSDTLGATLIEINKGPDLNYKDARDKEVKFNLVKNTFEIVKLLPDSKTEKNYIKI